MDSSSRSLSQPMPSDEMLPMLELLNAELSPEQLGRLQKIAELTHQGGGETTAGAVMGSCFDDSASERDGGNPRS
jgi:hypothetical protein